MFVEGMVPLIQRGVEDADKSLCLQRDRAQQAVNRTFRHATLSTVCLLEGERKWPLARGG